MASLLPRDACRQLFDSIDGDGDGYISEREFRKAMSGKRKVELKQLLRDTGCHSGYGTSGDWRLFAKMS